MWRNTHVLISYALSNVGRANRWHNPRRREIRKWWRPSVGSSHRKYIRKNLHFRQQSHRGKNIFAPHALFWFECAYFAHAINWALSNSIECTMHMHIAWCTLYANYFHVRLIFHHVSCFLIYFFYLAKLLMLPHLSLKEKMRLILSLKATIVANFCFFFLHLISSPHL